MKNTVKMISMVMVLMMVFCCSMPAYAEEIPEALSLTENLHKVNGTGTQTGGLQVYTSTTREDCHTLKMMGTLVGSNTGGRTMVVHVYYENSDAPIAWGQIQLNGTYYTLTTLTSLDYYPAGTYTIRAQPSFSGGYEVSNYFYN